MEFFSVYEFWPNALREEHSTWKQSARRIGATQKEKFTVECSVWIELTPDKWFRLALFLD
jgi:hypothetical protein